jgi:predicted HTH transcriptional regulator
LKKLSSFANTFGGTMIVGAKANSADVRLQDLPGVEEQPGCRQKVIQWCFDATSPPLIVAVSDAIPAPRSTGKFCYVVHVDESAVAPFYCNGLAVKRRLGPLVEFWRDAASSLSAASVSRVLKPFPTSILMFMVLTAGVGATVFSHPKGRRAV